MKRPLNGWWARGVMRHQDNWSKLQLCDHSVKVARLIFGTVRIVGRFIRGSPAEEVKRDYTPRRRQTGHKAIMEMKIVRETVHQDDRGFLTRVFAGANAVSISLDELFCEVHVAGAPNRPSILS